MTGRAKRLARTYAAFVAVGLLVWLIAAAVLGP